MALKAYVKKKLNWLSSLRGSEKNRIFRLYEKILAPLRSLPDFLIIGAPKCGTTSLFEYLSKNPYIKRPIYKEIHFFSSKLYHCYGLNYYKSFFPTKLHKFICKFIYNRKVSSFEASTSYFDDELTPKRVFSIMPYVKIILLLRNPIDRAYSHYNMLKRFNQISISFERTIKQEKREFLGIGTYIHPIKRWNEYFDLNDIFIIKSEEFFENPSKILSALYKFLKIPNYTLKRFRVYRSANKEDSGNKKAMDYDKLNEETRKELYNFFFPYNQLLYKYLGRDFQWNE